MAWAAGYHALLRARPGAPMEIARATATRVKKVPSQKPLELGLEARRSRKAAPALDTSPMDTTPHGNWPLSAAGIPKPYPTRRAAIATP